MRSDAGWQRQRRRSTRRSGLVLCVAVVALGLIGAVGGPAAAADLDQLRASGQVCERPDGLLHANTGDAAVRQQVADINRQRLATYERLAREKGATVEQVRVVSGEKLIARYGGCR